MINDVTKMPKEQQSCEDAISREELINELKLGYFNKDLQEGKNDPCVIDAMIDWAIRTVKRLPPVTPKQKVGRWIWQTEDIYECSECHECIRVKEIMNIPQYKACPICCARMEVQNDE